MRRPLTPARRRQPFRLEVVERHVFTITSPAVARQVRRALQAEDFERLDELITGLHVDGPAETGILSAVAVDARGDSSKGVA